MAQTSQTRRAFLAGTAGALAATQSVADTPADDETFHYQIVRSDEEWRAMLEREEYFILRRGSTELPKSSTLWNNVATGTYHCKGCALTVYASEWKTELNKGWAFFKHAQPDTVMMSIDGAPAYGQMAAGFGPMIEVHCRRCGSHLGHILKVDGKVLHCINGKALTFRPSVS